MNTAGASVTSTWAVGPAILNRTRKISACLRKLSLNAAKNWVQNRGAKRRVVSREEDMAISGGSSRARRPQMRSAYTCQQSKDDNLGKRTIRFRNSGCPELRNACS